MEVEAKGWGKESGGTKTWLCEVVVGVGEMRVGWWDFRGPGTARWS